MTAPVTVEAYLAALPKASRAALKTLRETIRAAAPEAFREELRPYEAGKGTIRFRMDQPVPSALVHWIAEARVEENAARGRR